MTSQRIDIFTGDYGSGKTEIAINYAIKLSQNYKRVKIVDLDIVNPYFRSRETREDLAEMGIEVVAPAGNLAQADLPALPPQILGAVQNKEDRVIFDVGGEEAGTIALGRFRQYIDREEKNLNFVINPYRPFTGNTEGVAEVIEKIQNASRFKVDYLISNPNLGAETELKHIIEGHQEIEKISDELGIPIKFLTINQNLIDKVDKREISAPVFALDLFMKRPWE
jgi:MinD-like ATPase involved in chromosome partitioning or flagellar assembly